MKEGRRVLLVENDKALLILFTIRLAASGYVVESAPDGMTALKAVHRAAPAALVADIDMPGLDGASLCRLAQRICPDLPVILMSAYPDTASRAARHCGASRVIGKPFAGDELVGTLHTVLGDRAAHASVGAGPRTGLS